MRLPHHDGSPLYVSDPAPALGDTVRVFVRVPRGTGVARVHLRWLRDAEPVFASAVVDRRDPAGDTWWRAELPVHNPVTRYRFLLGTTTGVRWLTGVGLTGHDVPDATDFRLVAHPPLRESAGETVLVLCRRAGGEPLRLTGLFPETRADNLYGGAKPLYTEPDGSITIDACGPAVQVWSFV